MSFVFLSALSSLSRSCFRSLVDLILPPRCFECGEIVSLPHNLCPPCWKKCTFLSAPWCECCGWPFPHHTSGPGHCPACHRDPPLFAQARSALAYDEGSRSFILRFKQGDATYLAPGLGNLMLRAGQDILSGTDYLIPVPLHWRRLFLRQYNQAALLSYYLTEKTGVPTQTNILKRHRSTLKQGYKNRKSRHKNMQGAFKVASCQDTLVRGKRLTLVDDVFTTGATLKECTRTLLKAGAKEVRILTLARVIMPL